MPVKRKLAKNKSKGRAYGTAGIQQSSRRTRRTMAKEINAGLQIVYRKLSEMHPNPKNPRKQGDDGIVPLAESIEANPQFFEARPILLSDRTGKFVIIGGERRWEAAQYLEMENAPSILFSGLTEEQEDEIMVRDNTHAGIWVDAKLQELAKIWGGQKVDDWTKGVNWVRNCSPENYGTDFSLPAVEKVGFRQVSFQLSDEMADVVLFATKAAHYTEEFYSLEGDEEDKNGNGVAVYLIAKWWLNMIAKEQGENYEKAKEDAEGLRKYLRDALEKSGHKAKDIDKALGTNGMSGHYFGESQWMFPTQKAYKIMQEIMPLERDYMECKLIELRYNLLKTLKH